MSAIQSTDSVTALSEQVSSLLYLASDDVFSDLPDPVKLTILVIAHEKSELLHKSLMASSTSEATAS